ncbi:Para-hydroxybenzoate--polyprenyltransferase, mitochondrial precursor (PHB:polyprenyltransferase) [Puttea exsequens]|nr:Para-hydroxybenzoate--polyprenyltransferase, mitochondrial precursor (PHB:polyprenyltransferase) [Puttea exsequens]
MRVSELEDPSIPAAPVGPSPPVTTSTIPEHVARALTDVPDQNIEDKVFRILIRTLARPTISVPQAAAFAFLQLCTYLRGIRVIRPYSFCHNFLWITIFVLYDLSKHLTSYARLLLQLGILWGQRIALAGPSTPFESSYRVWKPTLEIIANYLRWTMSQNFVYDLENLDNDKHLNDDSVVVPFENSARLSMLGFCVIELAVLWWHGLLLGIKLLFCALVVMGVMVVLFDTSQRLHR